VAILRGASILERANAASGLPGGWPIVLADGIEVLTPRRTRLRARADRRGRGARRLRRAGARLAERASGRPRSRALRMRGAVPLLCVVLSVFFAGGCGSSSVPARSSEALVARSVGRGARYRPPPTAATVAKALPVDAMRCGSKRTIGAAHLEVFVYGHVVVIAAGIGVAPPLRRRGAYVLGGRCTYPLHTLEPTGLVLIADGPERTLGDLFDLWGQTLTTQAVAGFRAPTGHPVAVFIDGARWSGPPAAAPLSAGAQITVEFGEYVTPHAHYEFPALRSLRSGARP